MESVVDAKKVLLMIVWQEYATLMDLVNKDNIKLKEFVEFVNLVSYIIQLHKPAIV
jgi:hypothetical protein